MDKIGQALASIEGDAQVVPVKVPVIGIPGTIQPRGVPIQIQLPLDLDDVELIEVFKFVSSAIDLYRARRDEIKDAATASPIAVPNHQIITPHH